MISLIALLRRAGIALELSFVLIALPASAQEQVVITDPIELTTGLTTVPMLDRSQPGFRVVWIAWDSPFRMTTLKVGDIITGIDQHPFFVPTSDPDLQRFVSQGPGQVAEGVYWAANGRIDNSPVILDIERRGESSGTFRLDIAGAVAAKRRYFDPGQQRWLVGLGGPAELLNDGFGTAWSTWYDKFVADAEDVLDGGWERRSFNNREALAAFTQNAARVEFLKSLFPGPYTESVAGDYEHVIETLQGTPYTLGPDALAFRQMGQQKIAEVSAAGLDARNHYIAALTDRIEPPALDPLLDDRSAITGKTVVLPPIATGDWVVDFNRNWLVATPSGASALLVSEDDPMMAKLFAAMRRYRSAVSPDLGDTISIIGKIADKPQMLVRNNAALVGLQVFPTAASVDDKMFIDLEAEGEEPRFAGESASASPTAMVPDDASPRAVMEAFIMALKAGDRARWDSLFATWRASAWGTSKHTLYEPYVPQLRDFEWVDGRRLILEKVADARVVYVGTPYTILSGADIPGAPTIEEVVVTIDHIGAFDGEYRSFVDVTVHREWTLQRRDGGPWRITTLQGL